MPSLWLRGGSLFQLVCNSGVEVTSACRPLSSCMPYFHRHPAASVSLCCHCCTCTLCWLVLHMSQGDNPWHGLLYVVGCSAPCICLFVVHMPSLVGARLDSTSTYGLAQQPVHGCALWFEQTANLFKQTAVQWPAPCMGCAAAACCVWLLIS